MELTLREEQEVTCLDIVQVVMVVELEAIYAEQSDLPELFLEFDRSNISLLLLQESLQY